MLRRRGKNRGVDVKARTLFREASVIKHPMRQGSHTTRCYESASCAANVFSRTWGEASARQISMCVKGEHEYVSHREADK